MRRAFVIALSAAALVVAPLPARADISGPCTGTLAGLDVRRGHGDAGSAIKIAHDATVSVGGSVAGRATAVRYAIELAGIQRQVPVTIRTGQRSSSWSGTVEISKYTWAGVGLFKVVGAASTSAGRCSGVVYVCITGKSPVTTAAGGTGTAALIGGLILLAVTIAKAKGRSAGESAMKAFFPGAIAGAGLALVLQQACVTPLDVPTAAIVPIAVGIGGSVLAPVVGGILGDKPPKGGYAPVLPSTAPPPQDIAPEATHVTLQGPNAINTLVAAGATPVPGTIYLLPPDKDLPGIIGSSFGTKKIPDPANPGRTIDVIDPDALVVIAAPGAVPAPAADVSMLPPPPPPPAPPAPPPPVTTGTPPDTTTPPETTTPPVTTKPPVTTTPPVTTKPPDTTTPSPATTQPTAAKAVEDHPVVKQLVAPGGGSATIPPGDVGPLIPATFRDGDGNIKLPNDPKIPGWVRGFVNGEPPPKLAIEHGGLVITPAGKLTEIIGKITQSKVRARIELKDGKLTGFGRFDSAIGSKDVTKDVQQGLDAFNKRLEKERPPIEVKSLKIDATGIHITTGPK